MADNHDMDRLVDDLVHGLLSPEEAGRVERLCRERPEYGRALDRARHRLAMMQAVPPAEASSELLRATLDRVDDSNRPSRFRFRLGVATLATLAASLALLATAHLYYANLKPTTIDLSLLGQRELLAATPAAVRVRLVDRATNEALAGVPVVVRLSGQGESKELASFTTDAKGTGGPRLDLPDWPDGTYRLEVSALLPAGAETLSQPVKLKRAARLMLSSDKPVYQPGQKILLRSLALRRPDLKPVANRAAVFTLTDPRGNVLFKHSQPTSRFGIASAECELDREIQEGTYTIACDVEGTESRLSVEVRRYVLPKFKLTLRPDRPYYAPGAKATVRVQADTFFGKPVAGARLDFELVSKAGQLVTSGNATTTADGVTRLDINLPANLAGREDDGGDARLTLTAMLTDSAGQKQAASCELLVAAEPVRVSVVPEAGRLVAGVPNTVYVMVTRPDGQPLPGVRVKLTCDSIDAEAVADERGVAAPLLTPASGDAGWTVRVTDAAGELITNRTGQFAGGDSGGFLVRLDRAVYKAGQTMTVSALGGGVEPVFVDLLKDGQTMLSRVVEMSQGEGELVIDLPPEMFGTLRLVAYRFSGRDGLPARKSRVVYVAPPAGLRVEASLDKGEYRPGKSAMLNLRLFDDQGRPTPGAVSLAAVDEAVFAVLTQRPGSERAFYTLEQELLKPVYAIYPWRPEDDDRAAQRDRALFARTAQEIDAPNESRKGFQPRTEPDPHSMSVRSLPVREQETRELRASRLDLVKRGWVVLVLASMLSGYVAAWMCVPALDMLKMHAVCAVGLLFLGAFAFLLLGTRAGRQMAFDAVGSAMPEAFAMKESAKKSDDFGPPESRRSGPALPRVRKDFPETLLWKPELITDDDGKLPPLTVPLADSITTWRLSATAVSADGRLGAATLPIKVFQPFFVDLDLPTSLSRGDEVGLRVVVHNYLDKPQTVALTLAEAPWFSLEGKPAQQIALAPNEVRAARFTIKVNRVGDHALKVTALAGEVGDAIERTIEVIPDGKRVEFAHSGGLVPPAEHTLTVPPTAIDGSVKAFVKVYPTGFSQLVEGLENIFRMPAGCFEQTSSTTYPNVLALDYIRRNKIEARDAEAKARQYIHLGYQRLVGFEVPGGGFDWYGRPPASVPLTAYGLMEFVDMSRVHDVDPRLIERTRAWLLAQRWPDGGWATVGPGGHIAGARDAASARLATTAYVAWAIYSRQGEVDRIALGDLVRNVVDAKRTLDFLLSHKPGDIGEPHSLALVCLAVASIDPNNLELPAYLDRLAAMGKKEDDGRKCSWARDDGRTLFYGAGVAGRAETTALAALALTQGKRHSADARAALAWLVANKDAHGTWHSTQATVMALKALLAGGSSGGSAERRVVVSVGKHTQEVIIPADQSEVLKQIDISKHLAVGDNRVRLEEKSKTGVGYQVVFRYHVPGEKDRQAEPLAIALDYDKTDLSVGGAVKVKATVTNRQATTAPMVMLDLPIPPGFAAESADFATLVADGKIARFQVLPRSVLVYLRGLEPAAKLELQYTLKATSPVRAAALGARVYEYYDPQKQGSSPATRFVVRPAD